MTDEFGKKRIAAFTIAIGRALGRSDQEIRTTARSVFSDDLDNVSIPHVETSEIEAALHESYDGTGFPMGLKGDEIPLGARILRIVLAFDALIVPDPPALAGSISKAKEEIQRASGTVFDPKIVNAFLEMPDGIWADLIQELSDFTGPQ